jgi:hypothetical protein
MRFLRYLIRDNRGSAEAALVLSPLLALFLIGAQISVATHLRNQAQMEAQNEASTRAISGDFLASDDFSHIDSGGDGQTIDLLITHRETKFVNLLPGIIGGLASGREISLNGIAIIENGP